MYEYENNQSIQSRIHKECDMEHVGSVYDNRNPAIRHLSVFGKGVR